MTARRRVLLIDADEASLEAMVFAFAAAGYEVLEAADGDEGLWLFDQRGADLVVTDATPPLTSGREIISSVRRRNAQAKVVALSARGAEGLSGADAVMARPFRLDDLLILSATLLERASRH